MPKKMTFKENKKIKKVVIKNGITSIQSTLFQIVKIEESCNWKDVKENWEICV